MHLKISQYLFLLLCLSGLLWTACASDASEKPDTITLEGEKVNADQRTEELARLERINVQQDNLDVEKDYYEIRYVAINEPMADVVSTKPAAAFTDNAEDAASDKTIRFRNFNADTKRDRPPLLEYACLGNESMEECASNAVSAYVVKNLKYPAAAKKPGVSGYEMIRFTVDAEGQISPTVRVVSEHPVCEGCAEAAVAVVQQMPTWIPALENGEPVATEITLPVRFDYERG